jgi:putative heme-binding domain-containing protein
MIQRTDVMPALERVLMAWSNRQRPDFKPGSDPNRRLDDITRTNALTFWKGWYKEQFRQDFIPPSETAAERSDAEVHRFLLGDSLGGGNALRGAKVYEALQCQTCHSGGVTPGREGRFFGPDLAGVTRRLTRAELADALVFPSKQVPDRFKAVEVTLKDSTTLTGFLTEQTAENITLADREQLHSIARNKVESISPLSTSLMPERLLNRLSWEELRDLHAFLEGGVAGEKPKSEIRGPK